MKRYVGIDIGGTAIKYGLLDENGAILEKDSMDTPTQEGGKAILAATMDIVAEYQKRYALSGVCISSAGMVDCEKGEIFYAGPTIPDYAGTRFKEAIEGRFQIPCEIENDVNCAGLAEYRSGAAMGSRVALCLTVGTGIGGCAVLDGKVFHGCSGSALEIGYLNMDGGTFETLGAASVLSRKVAQAKGDAPAEWNGIRIFEQAREKDPVCVQAIDEMCDVLGKGIANICYVLNPDVVVLGGGIMAQGDFLRPRIEAALKRYLNPVLFEQLRLEFAHHKNDAGMLGAFYHFSMYNRI